MIEVKKGDTLKVEVGALYGDGTSGPLPDGSQVFGEIVPEKVGEKESGGKFQDDKTSYTILPGDDGTVAHLDLKVEIGKQGFGGTSDSFLWMSDAGDEQSGSKVIGIKVALSEITG